MKLSKSLLFGIGILLFSVSNAQQKKFELGNVSVRDFTEDNNLLDPDAPAHVLFDIGRVGFTYNNVTKKIALKFTRKTKIKIISTDGLKAANLEIKLYKNNLDKERVSSIKAICYNYENGWIKEYKAKRKNRFLEKSSDYLSIMKVAIPNARVGSILEIEYTIISDFTSNLREWEFQSVYPVLRSEYYIQIPEYLGYRPQLRGYLHVQTVGPIQTRDYFDGLGAGSETVNFNEFAYSVDNAPAFKREPFMTSKKDVISKVRFDLEYTNLPSRGKKFYMHSWPDVDKLLIKHLNRNKYWKPTQYCKKICAEIIPEMEGADTLSWLYARFRKQVKWNGRRSEYIRRNFEDVWLDEEGNSSELNMALLLMLKNFGYQVTPVFVSTRSHGHINRSVPTTDAFNHLIIAMERNGAIQYLDVSQSKYLPMNNIHYDILGRPGRKLTEEGGEWVVINSLAKDKIRNVLDLTYDGDWNTNITWSELSYGYAANTKRQQLNDVENEKEGLKKTLEEYSSLNVDSFAIENKEEISQPISISFHGSMDEGVEDFDDQVLISPFPLHFLGSNPFVSDERRYPVDLGYKIDHSFNTTIHIPKGYSVEKLPDELAVGLPNKGGKLIYRPIAVGDLVTVSILLKIEKTFFTPEEYPQLKKIFGMASEKMEESIILKKDE